MVFPAISAARTLPFPATSLKYPSSLLNRSYSCRTGRSFSTITSPTTSFNRPIPHSPLCASSASACGLRSARSKADQINSRFETPGRFSGTYVMLGIESVTVDFSLEMIRSGGSVMLIRDEAIGADLDIFCDGSRRDRIRLDRTDSRSSLDQP